LKGPLWNTGKNEICKGWGTLAYKKLGIDWGILLNTLTLSDTHLQLGLYLYTILAKM